MRDPFEQRPRREARVPDGRAERIARLGSMVAGIAGEAALEALRRASGQGDGEGSLLMTRANAERVTQTLADLRGAAMKLGQLLSLQGNELLPPELSEILGTLRDHATFMPESQVRRVMTKELGADWLERFAEFDFEPVAAASIGQVHAAQARDGRDLALKLQYPGVMRTLSSDVDNLARVLNMTRLLPREIDLAPLLPEIKKELRREADYRREADNTERYRDLVADDPDVAVPAVHRDLSTRHLLALERVYARPIEDLRSPEHTTERRDRVGAALIRLVLRELFSFRFMQTDPNFANYMFDAKHERLVLLDFGSARRFARGFTATYGELIRSALERDHTRLLQVGVELGFLCEDQSLDAKLAFSDLCELFVEPLRSPDGYDFAASDLARRARERAEEAVRDFNLPQPPPETLFLHRKLAGSFLLCAHIGARVDGHAIYRECLAES